MWYKALLLDFYGTLVEEDDLIVAEIVEAIAARSPVSSDAKLIARDWQRYFQDACVSSFGDNYRKQRDIEIESLELLCTKYQVNLTATALSKKLFEYWQSPRRFGDAEQFLSENRLPICIVSNIDTGDLLRAIQHLGWSFDLVVTSEHCRSYKPRAEMFECALNLLHCQANEVLYVGDSLSSDVAGAQKCGIATAWINRKNRNLSGGSPVPTTVADNISQLPHCLTG